MILSIRLPWESPPLRSNDRMHWAARARAVRDIRDTAHLLGVAQRRRLAAAHYEHGTGPFWLPISEPCTVTLVWEVTDRHVRDADAGQPTLKAVIDGLVDADILSADRHEIVVVASCRVQLGGAAGVRVDIERFPAVPHHPPVIAAAPVMQDTYDDEWNPA